MWQFLARYSSLRNLGIISVEHLILVVCTLVGFRVRFIGGMRLSWGGEHLILKAIGIALIFQTINYFLDLYDFREAPLQSLRRRLKSLATGSVVVLFLMLAAPSVLPGRGATLIALCLIVVFYLLWHAALGFYVGLGPHTNVLVIGTNRLAQEVARELIKRPEMRLRVSGFLSNDPKMIGVRLVNPSVIGMTEDLSRLVVEQNVRRVVVALTDRRGVLPISELLKLKCRGVRIEDGTTTYERVTGKIAIENLKPSWLIFNEGFEVSKATLLLKSVISVVVSSILLLLTSPILLLAAIAVKLSSKGPIVFRQERVGQNGRIFELLKFRSMRADAEASSGPVWAALDDPRVTRVGRILRKTRIDELPQLWNVLRGDMHFVGPRPERPVFVQELREKIPYYGLRHIVKPGITGWAQINYGYGRTEEDTVEKLQYDLFYIKNLSVLLDCLIMLETVKAVAKGKGV